MIKINSLKRELDIINSEGPILSLLTSNDNTAFLKSRLHDGSGYVCFAVNESSLKSYALSEVTLDELYQSSPDSNVVIENSDSTSEVPKITYVGNLTYGDALVNQLSEGLVSRRFKKDYGS